MSGGSIGGTLGTALGVALAPETGGLSLAIPGFAGAAGSALGGAMTGSKNIWRDALLGGIGGGLSGGLNNVMGGTGGLGALFNGGSGGEGAISSALGDEGEMFPGQLGDEVANEAADAGASSLGSNITKILPYAGLAGGALFADNSMKPKTLGPSMQSHPSNPGQVAPLSRTAQNVDPNSYYAPSTAGARSYFSNYTMQPQFMAKGGRVHFKNGGSSSASSSNIPSQAIGGKLANPKNKTPSMYPVKGRGTGPIRYYADGGSAGIGMVNGPGDGQSDSIPAQLSDGEFVISAPVVSALGNGSNNAGAKKLAGMQKKVLQKHYKGGKPHKAMGLGSYVH